MSGKDHTVTIILGVAVVILSIFVFSQPWYLALTIATVVSGISEFLIKEVPEDPTDYDSEEYELWDAMMDNSATKDSNQTKEEQNNESQPSEPHHEKDSSTSRQTEIERN